MVSRHMEGRCFTIQDSEFRVQGSGSGLGGQGSEIGVEQGRIPIK